MHHSLPPTDLKRLKEEVLSKPPEGALPCNLSREWIALIARDIDHLFEDGVSTEEGTGFLAAPLALIAHLLCAKSGRQRVKLNVDTFLGCCSSYRTELALEAMNRDTLMRGSSASLETIFTDREIDFNAAPSPARSATIGK